MRSSPIRIGAVLAGMLPPVLCVALDVPSTVCNGLVGCSSGPANLIAQNLPDILGWMLNLAAFRSVLLIVWAGFNMVIAFGDEGKVSQFKWGVINVLLGLILAISSQVIVAFIGTQPVLATGDATNIVTAIFTTGIVILKGLLNVTFLIVIVFAGIRMVYAQGKQDEFSKARSMIIWAIAGAVVVNLSVALINALLAIFP